MLPAFSDGSAAIGSGYHATGNSDITITDHATVEAASLDSCAIGSGHDSDDKVTITISGKCIGKRPNQKLSSSHWQ